MLHQLVYLSTATRRFEPVELTKLLMNARRKNAMLEITGILAYHDGLFLQILEGMQKTVGTMYDIIRADVRHENCFVLHQEAIDQRDFPEWTMGFVDAKHFVPQSLPGYNDLFRREFNPHEFGKNPNLALQFLRSFRQGKWRDSVYVS